MRGGVVGVVVVMSLLLTGSSTAGRALVRGHRGRRGGGGGGGSAGLQQPAQIMMMLHVKLGVEAGGGLVFSFQRRARDLNSRGAGGRHSQRSDGESESETTTRKRVWRKAWGWVVVTRTGTTDRAAMSERHNPTGKLCCLIARPLQFATWSSESQLQQR